MPDRCRYCAVGASGVPGLAGAVVVGSGNAAKRVLPGRDAVCPSGDGELPASRTVDREAAAVAVVPERHERDLGEAPLTRAAHAHRTGKRVVPVLEDGRVDLDVVADRRLDGVAAAVDDRLDRLDLDTGRFVPGKGHDVRFSSEGLS